MKTEIQHKLKAIIEQHGHDVIHDHRRVKALLTDYFPHNKREVRVLMMALEEGIVFTLLREGETVTSNVLVNKFSQQLHDELGVDLTLARWAVETWAMVLLLEMLKATPAHTLPPTQTPVNKKPWLFIATMVASIAVGGVWYQQEQEKQAEETARLVAIAEQKEQELNAMKAEQVAREQAEAKRLAREKAEADRLAREKAEAERLAKEKAEAERLAREKAEAERLAREKAEAERLAREKIETERLAREKAEVARLAREKAEAERLARESAKETARLTALAEKTTLPLIASRYRDNQDGTITDTKTNLQWKRCAEGQIWTGNGCSGEASKYTWEDALSLSSNFAGKTDWRLPTIDELKSLVLKGKTPTTHEQAFPNTPPGVFWSSSPSAHNSHHAWGVDFDYGYGYGNFRYHYLSARLVRGGQ